MTHYRLLIFDVDGVLAKPDTGRLLPYAASYFSTLASKYAANLGPKIALAANQGGVGLRRWMEIENFGEPELYPTQRQAEAHIYAIANQITELYAQPAVYISFAYQSKRGIWSPTPPEGKTDPRWRSDWRKPAPGMLLAAMAEIGVSPQETLMVSDDHAGQQAARAAGCHFLWGHQFFPSSSQPANYLKTLSKSNLLAIAAITGVTFILCCFCLVLLNAIATQ